MRKLILLLLPLLLLSRLYTPSPGPDLNWLDGSWHDPDHPTTRLLWSQTGQHGARGMLTSDAQTTVFSVEADGRLMVRELGPKLTDTQPAQEHRLISQGPQQLTYRKASLRHLSSRSDPDEFLLDWNGRSLTLRRD